MKGLRIDIRCLDMAGRVYFEEHRSGDFAAGVAAVAEITADCRDGAAGNLLMIELRLTDGEGRVIFADETLRGAPDFRKAFRQAEAIPRVTMMEQNKSEMIFRLHNDSGTTALNVRLCAPELPLAAVYWQDNYCCIAPGAGRDIALRYTENPPETIRLSGWNVPEMVFPVSQMNVKPIISNVETMIPACGYSGEKDNREPGRKHRMKILMEESR
jgi:hypothetical protein